MDFYGAQIFTNPNAIVVAIINNLNFAIRPETSENPTHMKLTPWLVAHKIGHALNAAEDDGNPIASEWVKITNELHGVFDDHPQKFASIMTFKSAKAKNINMPELDLELVAQYLIQGKITFKYDTLLGEEITAVKHYETLLNEFLTQWFSKLKGHILVAA